MASKWQKWMPFHIDKFRGSPSVQAMHPAARAGYLYLLAYAWQTDDCTIPSGSSELAEISGLGDELWAQYGERIMRRFEVLNFDSGDGKIRNAALYAEWNEAKRLFDARCKAAHHTNKRRSPDADRTVSVRPAHGERTVTDESAHAQRTVSDTHTQEHRQEQEQKQRQEKPFARSVPPEELAGTLPLANGTDFPVSKSDVDRWVQAFPGVSVKQELKKFKAWCEDNPTRKKTAKGVKSAVFRWLDKAQNSGGGNGRQDQKRIEGNVGATFGEDGPDLYAALYGPIEQGKPQ